MKEEGRRKKAEVAELRTRTNVAHEAIPIREVLIPRNEKVTPADYPELPYIGLDDIEAHSMRLLGSKPAASMKSSAKRFYPGDVLYSRLRPYLNKVWLSDRNGICSSEFIVMPGNQLVDPGFLALRLNAIDFVSFANSLNAGDRPRVDFDQISSFCLPPFSLSQQHRIVTKIEELFSELDKGIESLKTAQAQLKVYRQAVLKHALEGKLTAQWREESRDKLEKPERLLARIKKERAVRYERQLKEWEVAVKEWEGSGKSGRKPPKPQKPKNPLPIAVSQVDNPFWTRLFLDELAAEAVLGKMLDKEKNTGTPRYYLGNINLRWGKFDLENLKTMKVEESEIERYRLEKGDLVVCEGGEPGRCAVWEGQESTMLIQKALHRVRFTESYSPYFAYYFMTYAASSGLLSPNFTGSTIKHLTGKGLGSVLFPLCTLAEQNQIVHFLDRAFNICDELGCQIEREIRRSNSLRQSVLSKAFSGQLVPQDPHDEPASVLLDRIRAEREKAVKNNHTKKTKKRKTTARIPLPSSPKSGDNPPRH